MRRGLLALAAALAACSLASCGGDEPSATPAVTTPAASAQADGPSSEPTTIPGSSESVEMLDGIPQRGLALGWPDAPVTLLEFIDLQCPFCRHHQMVNQKQIVDELVRTKQAQIAFVPLAFLGPDSIKARNVLLRLTNARKPGWTFINLFYWNQGQENSGYVTDEFLERIVAAVPGTEPADAAPTADASIEGLSKQSDLLGQVVIGGHEAGTPGFTVGPTGGNPVSYEWIQLLKGEPVPDQIIKAVRKAAKKAEAGSAAGSGPTA